VKQSPLESGGGLSKYLKRKNELDFFFGRSLRKESQLQKSFSKNTVKNSKMICRKCKKKLLKNTNNKLLVFPKMFLENKSEISPLRKSSFKIFKSLKYLKDFTLSVKSICSMRKPEIKLENSLLGKKLFSFNDLNFILIKFLTGNYVSPCEIKNLSETHKKLFFLFVNKKKGPKHKILKLDEDSLANLNQKWTEKRFEENLRFIVNKAFKFLREVFRIKLFPNLVTLLDKKLQNKTNEQKFEYCFSGYYFESVACAIDKPIESYFHPKHRCHALLQNFVPKTISQHYLNLICTSPLFKRDLKVYFDQCIKLEARHDIINKINSQCKKWENFQNVHGEAKLLREVEFQFHQNPKCKLAWGIQEVVSACQNLSRIVNLAN
jgi:hypothetical protein